MDINIGNLDLTMDLAEDQHPVDAIVIVRTERVHDNGHMSEGVLYTTTGTGMTTLLGMMNMAERYLTAGLEIE
ncbi:hypothetical protein DFO66_103372 [Brevibacterium sanguinis]|uniref:Uncharacterized protein n=2 Tax=Brevibacterium TaxID=1696 RepID=A0A366IKV8_9MICO|nr:MULTISPECIES: hypothetical protein [Brevibacterium]RBP66422.1 hypothetical protein DFO66_103372 [Brevibacterium sanguinis]RBP73074.1 hypothetical protein DFO65_103372 [Brevibacterium celere]